MTAEGITPSPAHQPAVAGWGTFEARGLGTLWLTWTSKGLLQLDFHHPDTLQSDELPVPSAFSVPLLRYFEGQSEGFAGVPLDLRGTEFQRRVWRALQRVPWGHLRTYGGIASDIGSPRAMRAVGQANHVNPLPIIVPCHRIVEAGYRLGGYGGGHERKRFLLALEGVQFHEGILQPGQLELF